MFRVLLVTALATMAVCQDYLQPYQMAEPEDLLPAAELPPGALVRVRRQFFGGVTKFPTGGFSQQAGFRTPERDVRAWGSLSQSFNGRGLSSPISYSGGLDLTTPNKHGASFSALHVPHQGSQAKLAGNLNLLDTKEHNVNAFASHTKTFDPHFREVGHGSSTAGVGYEHVGGAALTVSGTRTPGAPNTASIAGSLPLHTSKDGSASVVLTGQTNVAQGLKPDHQIGLSVSKTF